MEWKHIRTEYIASETSLRELAEKYGVSFSTIQKKSMEEKWTDLRKKKRRRAEEKIIDTLSTQEARKAANIIEVADKLLDKISEFVDVMPLESMASTQSLKQLTSALKDLKDVKGFKSDADMREQEARIKNLEKQLNSDDQGDKHIVVTIDGELGKYSQ